MNLPDTIKEIKEHLDRWHSTGDNEYYKTGMEQRWGVPAEMLVELTKSATKYSAAIIKLANERPK